MTIGQSVANKIKKFADEVEKKRASEKAKTILEADDDDDKVTDQSVNEPSSETHSATSATTESSKSSAYPDGLDIDMNSNDPAGQLAKIEEFYNNKRAENSSVPESLDLTRLDEPSMTDEDVKREIAAKLESKYANLYNTTNNSYSNKINAKTEAKEAAKTNYADGEGKVNSYYDSASENISNDVLKRGLARSSIAVLEIDGIEKSRANELSRLASELSSELSALDDQVTSLRAEQENALEMLDLDYASELESEIQKGINNLESKRKEVIEFNNNINKLEAEYQIKREDAAVDNLSTLAKTQSSTGIRLIDDSEETRYKIQYITEYLSKLSRADALKKLTSDSSLAYYLGDAWSDVYYLQMARPIS